MGQRIAFPACGKRLWRERDDELPVGRKECRGADAIERLRAGQVSDHAAGQQLDHRPDGGALVPPEGKHGTGEGRFGIDSGPSIRVESPALRQRLAGAAVKLDLAAGGDRGREIEHIGQLPVTRPAEGQGIGAQQRPRAAGRRDRRIARTHRQTAEAERGQRLDLGP